jgi:hypothetical protein
VEEHRDLPIPDYARPTAVIAAVNHGVKCSALRNASPDDEKLKVSKTSKYGSDEYQYCNILARVTHWLHLAQPMTNVPASSAIFLLPVKTTHAVLPKQQAKIVL